MAGGIPMEAVGASVAVLLYSLICLFFCSILVALLISFGERYTYVTIQSFFTALSTLASIIQQIHFAARWHYIKQAKFEKAIRALEEPGLTFIGGAHKADRALFLIQFWCYNIMALNIFFWSIALFTSAWGYRTPWLGKWISRTGPISKAFSILFPALIIGLMQAKAVLHSKTATFIIVNGTMSITLTAGSIFLILTLYRYVKTRRLVAGSSNRGRWWASQDSQPLDSHYVLGTSEIAAHNSIYDRALITRFSIGFVVLFFFLGVIIFFSFLASKNNASVVAAGHPDLRPSSATTEILLFIPGATTSLVTFLVFGTAKSWHKYRELLFGGCGIRNRVLQRRFIRQKESPNLSGNGRGEDDLEFARMPKLHTTPSSEGSPERDETTKRPQMFVASREIVISGGQSTDANSITGGAGLHPSNTEFENRLPSPATNTAVPFDFVLSQPYTPRAPDPHSRFNNVDPSEMRRGNGVSNMQFHRPLRSLGQG